MLVAKGIDELAQLAGTRRDVAQCDRSRQAERPLETQPPSRPLVGHDPASRAEVPCAAHCTWSTTVDPTAQDHAVIARCCFR
jgi:hypothetical protein